VASAKAGRWVTELRAAGVPVEPVAEPDRMSFAASFVDDPVNRQLGRVTSYQWGERGQVDQPCFPPRLGPRPQPRAKAGIPGLGEHTAEVRQMLGSDKRKVNGDKRVTNRSAGPITDEWITQHFDPLSPALAREFHPTLARARSMCPVAHSDVYSGGFWVLTRYEDVLKVAQDWQTFSSELGITVPAPPVQHKILPVTVDPPLQREFKRLVNAHFTPAKIAPWAEPTRALVNHLIDGFIERGECDFMTEFAGPLPGLAFFGPFTCSSRAASTPRPACSARSCCGSASSRRSPRCSASGPS
jgi:hypothetical protein